jgi:hypothetical protein
MQLFLLVDTILYFCGDQVVNQVLEGEGIGWLKLNRLKKLMEDESYRNFVVSKLNRTLDRKISPDDHIDDVVSRPDDVDVTVSSGMGYLNQKMLCYDG